MMNTNTTRKIATLTACLLIGCLWAGCGTVQSQDVTTIRVTDEVKRDKVVRLGINASGDSYWDSAITKVRVAENFEGVMYRMTTWGPEQDANGVSVWYSPPAGAWDAMKGKVKYTLLGPPNKGVSGLVKDIQKKKIKDGRELTYIVFDKEVQPSTSSKNGILLEYNDFAQGAVKDNANAEFWNTEGNTASIGDTPPGSFGQSALWLKGGEKRAHYAFVPMWSSQAEQNGVWRVDLWAKQKTPGALFEITCEGAKTLSVPVEAEWKKFEMKIETAGLGEDKNATIRLVADKGEILVDDVVIWKEEEHKNPTAFRDPLVDLLLDLKPGTLRYLQMGGSDFVNNIKPRLEQMGWTSNFGNLTKGGRNDAGQYRFNMHDFYTLCEYIKTDPWFCLPGTIHIEEMDAVMEYLAAPPDVGYGKVRAALGQPKPWTEVFENIYIEFGNEAWNPGGSYAIGSFNGPDHWKDLIDRGRASAHHKPNMVFVAGSHAGNPGVTQGLLRDVPNADHYAIAPYMLNQVRQSQVKHLDTTEKLFEWATAYALRRVLEPQGNVYRHAEMTKAAGKILSIYEHNFHWTNPRPGQADAPSLELRNELQASLGAGLIVINDALLQLREHNVQPQCQFNLNQSDYFGIKLWGFVPGLTQKNQRYRPHFLAEKIANTVMGGKLMTTTHSENQPRFSSEGHFEDNRNATQKYESIPAIWSYAFEDGGRRALIVFNLGVSTPRNVKIEFPGAVAGSKARRWLLSANKITDNNEPETAEPRVKIVESELEGFANGFTTTLPPFSMTAWEWQTN